MRLDKEDYNRAVGLLKRYNYNVIKIMNIRTDILSIGVPAYDGMPKAPYKISDSVYNQFIQLQEDRQLQRALKEYKIVEQALKLVNKDSKYIFEEFYMKNKTKWQIVSTGMSEATFKRRKQDLIYAVNDEIKNMSQN